MTAFISAIPPWQISERFKRNRSSSHLAPRTLVSFSRWWKDRCLTSATCMVNTPYSLIFLLFFTQWSLRLKRAIVSFEIVRGFEICSYRKKPETTLKDKNLLFSLYQPQAFDVFMDLSVKHTNVCTHYFLRFALTLSPEVDAVWWTVVALRFDRVTECTDSFCWPCYTTSLLHPTWLPSSPALHLSYFSPRKYILAFLNFLSFWFPKCVFIFVKHPTVAVQSFCLAETLLPAEDDGRL